MAAAPAGGGVPARLTSFVGRDALMAQARRLLAGGRLLTLTGPGGSGKTRLALELADAAEVEYAGGVVVVQLAGVTDPELVLPTIVETAGLRGHLDRGPLDALARLLAGRRVLLVLDNLEHLLEAAPVVAQLLREVVEVTVLATSRAPLRISGEQELEVPPLDLPEAGAAVAAAASSEAVRLFTERATAVLPGFALDPSNSADVVGIVRRLDGLPLAIELAAARIKALPPALMHPLLDRSLAVLVGGPRDLPHRQRTLRDTIAWSFDLLSPDGKRLLDVCAAFRGGFELDSLRGVVEALGGNDVLAALQELVDQSLVQGSGDGSRFSVLETIRDFAVERRGGGAGAGAVERAHAHVFLALTDEAGRHLAGRHMAGSQSAVWLDRLDRELDNLRAALDWHQVHDAEQGLRLATAIATVWGRRGDIGEGRRRLRDLLALAVDAGPVRVAALNAAAFLAIDQGDLEDAGRLLAEAKELARRNDDMIGLITASIWSARVAVFGADLDAADAELGVVRALLPRAGDPLSEARHRHFIGLVHLHRRELETACRLFELNVEYCRRHGFTSLSGSSLTLLGAALADLGELDAAREALEAAVVIACQLGDHWMIPMQLTRLAALAARTGRPRAAMRLAGAAEAYADVRGSRLPIPWRARLAEWLHPARQALGPAAARLFGEGRRMTLDQAVAIALDPRPEDGDPAWARLTRRERDVAELVAGGMTNREIANRLVLSVRTVEVHVDRVLGKLGFTNRVQLAAWFRQPGSGAV